MEYSGFHSMSNVCLLYQSADAIAEDKGESELRIVKVEGNAWRYWGPVETRETVREAFTGREEDIASPCGLEDEVAAHHASETEVSGLNVGGLV